MSAVPFDRFDDACRVDWEWRNGHYREERPAVESDWWSPPMAGIRERVHERMRNTLERLGIEIDA